MNQRVMALISKESALTQQAVRRAWRVIEESDQAAEEAERVLEEAQRVLDAIEEKPHGPH